MKKRHENKSLKTGAASLEMKIRLITQADPIYPAPLKNYLVDTAPASISALGNIDILQNKSLAVFSSAKCPGKIILQTYDLMKNIREAGVTVISGFHSPMERECLNILLKGKQPVIICPARGLEGMRIKPEYITPLEEGSLLILSPFPEKAKRLSEERAFERNRFIAALAGSIFISHAAPNSKTEHLCKELQAWNKPLYTFQIEANSHLTDLGVKNIDGHSLFSCPSPSSSLSAFVPSS